MAKGVKIGITGLPEAGKTFALRKVIEMLEDDNAIVGGMLTEPIIEKGEKVGFNVIDWMSKQEGVIAHRNLESKTIVGDFGINLEVLESIGVGAINSVSAATFAAGDLAPELITAAFGGKLATMTAFATDTDPGTPGIQLPTNLAGTTVSFRDSQGMNRLSPLLFVSSGQVNYLTPAGTALGAATVTITSGGGSVSIGNVTIAAVAPGMSMAASAVRNPRNMVISF